MVKIFYLFTMCFSCIKYKNGQGLVVRLKITKDCFVYKLYFTFKFHYLIFLSCKWLQSLWVHCWKFKFNNNLSLLDIFLQYFSLQTWTWSFSSVHHTSLMIPYILRTSHCKTRVFHAFIQLDEYMHTTLLQLHAAYSHSSSCYLFSCLPISIY